jgi:hypothetical protein
MNLWRQVIFERNTATGSSVIAMGQSVGTGPDGGVAQHILHADNTVSLVWGNDREVVTYDDAGGAYWGAIAGTAGANLTTAADTKSAGDWHLGGWAGGAVVILNGTGAGQYRRIVVPGIGAEPTNPGNRTWVLDAPFAVPPGADSTVEIEPFRGRNVFAGDVFIDGGAFQFYGHALDNVVADTVFARTTGVVAWGQWRGWTPANASAGGGLAGEMGNGIQPNLRNTYLRLDFVGSLSAPNYNYSVGYDPFYARRFFATQPVDNAPPGSLPNSFIVFRGCAGGGGINLAAGTAVVVVEDGAFFQDAQGAGGGPCVLTPPPPPGGDPAPTPLVLVNRVNCTAGPPPPPPGG